MYTGVCKPLVLIDMPAEQNNNESTELQKNSRFPIGCKIFYLVAIICILSPVDIVPDIVPFLGLADDVALPLVALIDVCRRLLRK